MTSETSSRIAPLRFLVVEDNAFTSQVVARALQSLGAVEVHTARTGREGLDVVARLDPPPDVILLDLRMPEMGGVEMITRLGDRGFPGYVIITSGVDAETLASVEKVAGRNSVRLLGCLPKPIESAQLAELLAKVTDEAPVKEPVKEPAPKAPGEG
ncbi:MAG: response regulator [Candidatus Binatia bacterium]